MKKFAKLVAVFAALMLAWACFVACSNGDDDNGTNSDSNSDSNSGSNSNSNSGSNTGTNAGSNTGSDTASVKALQGLWIEEGSDWGRYFVDDTVYEALFDEKTKKYYYCEDGNKFSVSGTKIIMYYYDEEDNEREEVEYFEINRDTLILKCQNETETYKKNTEKPLPLSSKDFNKLGDSLFADSKE